MRPLKWRTLQKRRTHTPKDADPKLSHSVCVCGHLGDKEKLTYRKRQATTLPATQRTLLAWCFFIYFLFWLPAEPPLARWGLFCQGTGGDTEPEQHLGELYLCQGLPVTQWIIWTDLSKVNRLCYAGQLEVATQRPTLSPAVPKHLMKLQPFFDNQTFLFFFHKWMRSKA